MHPSIINVDKYKVFSSHVKTKSTYMSQSCICNISRVLYSIKCMLCGIHYPGSSEWGNNFNTFELWLSVETTNTPHSCRLTIKLLNPTKQACPLSKLPCDRSKKSSCPQIQNTTGPYFNPAQMCTRVTNVSTETEPNNDQVGFIHC